ncbi:MAG: DUF5808 domain-containing protein [Acidimicrobiales bacterium]
MSDNDDIRSHDSGARDGAGAGKSDKKVLGVPYDLRRPSTDRFKSRLYNPDDARLFPPKAFGVGWTINFYWIAHFATYLSKKRTPKN